MAKATQPESFLRRVTSAGSARRNQDGEPLNSVSFSESSWIGVISFVSMILFAAASAIVVGVSHNQTINSWEIQPSVLLAIFSAASNIAFTSAMATGVAVRFWLSASKGTPLSQLHYIWEHGRGFSLLSALRAGSQARKVVLVTTLANIMQFSSGPLMQRSTQQVAQDRTNTTPMLLDLATNIPDGWMGNIQDGKTIGFRRGMVQTQHWWRNDTMLTQNGTAYGCAGVCNGYVRGLGLTQHCSSSEGHLDLSTNRTDYSTVFLVNTTKIQDSPNHHVLRLRTEYLSAVDDNCMSTISIDTCDIEAAIVEYPVTIQGSVISLRRNELMKMNVIAPYISAGDSPMAPDGAGAGPLSGIDSFVTDYLSDNVTKRFNTVVNKTLYWGPGVMADIFFQPSYFYDLNETSPIWKCQLMWSSPTEYVLGVIHEWMFRAVLNVGNGTESQSFIATRTAPAIVFRADPRYLGAAVATVACASILVASLMWGWWRLNRRVTLSPLETANAFGAPILQDVEPDATINQILTKVRNVTFRVPENSPSEVVQVSKEKNQGSMANMPASAEG